MSVVEQNGRLDYSNFDNIDTDVLKAFLRADFDAPEAEQMDVDTIMYITNLLQEREKAENNEPDIDIAAARAKFDKEYMPLLNSPELLLDFEDAENKTTVSESKQYKVIPVCRTIWRNFASAAAIVVLLLFSGTVTAYALGYNPIAAIARWTESQFWFETENTSATNELLVTLKDYGVEEKLAPTWLPSGYNMESLNAFESDYKLGFNAVYTRTIDNRKEELSINIVKKQDDVNIIYEIDEMGAELYTTNNIDHYIADNLGKERIVWRNLNIECYISGDFTEDEAKKIIDSIYKE